MKTVIELAREAGAIRIHKSPKEFALVGNEAIERFAELVRADERNSWPAEMEAMERQVNILTDALHEERERTKWDVHSCGPTCKRYACVATREAVAAEREACAQLVDDNADECNGPMGLVLRANAEAIRNRSGT